MDLLGKLHSNLSLHYKMKAPLALILFSSLLLTGSAAEAHKGKRHHHHHGRNHHHRPGPRRTVCEMRRDWYNGGYYESCYTIRRRPPVIPFSFQLNF